MSERSLFARATAWLWFHRLELRGPAVPPGPVLLLLNHPNGLLDALVPAALLDRRPRFVAKSTLWKLWPLRPLLALFDPIPVQRTQDLPAGASDAERRAAVDATFARVHEAFARGELVALFPEGISHTGHDLAPLKTGAARMALGAPVRPTLVPAGLVYGERDLFRHGALLQLGPPIAAGDLSGTAPETVLELTSRIRAALHPLTLHSADAEELSLAQELAWLLAEGPRRGVDLEALHQRVTALRGWLAGLGAAERERVRGEAHAVRQWLHERGLRADQVGYAYPSAEVARWLPQAAVRLLVTALCLPFGLLFWPPYRLIGWLAARLTEERDVTATYKLLGGLFLLPLWAALLVALAVATHQRLLWLPAWALAAFVSLPLTERLAEDAQAVRGFLARGDPEQQQLAAARERLLAAVPALRATATR